MKKILGLTVAALLVMGLVGGGTWAYFTDPEYSTGNILTAGTLDLHIDGGDADVKVIEASVTDVKPGDGVPTPNLEFVLLENVGSLAGELDIAVSAITNTESAAGTEYTGDVIGGAGVGELGAAATMVLWIDGNEDGAFDNATNDFELNSDGTVEAWHTTTNPSLTLSTIDSYGSDNFNEAFATLDELGGTNDDVRFYISWQVPTSADNTCQGDAVSFDITFTLEQAIED